MICFHSGVFNSADQTGSGNGKDKWEINHPTCFSHNSKERVIAEPRSEAPLALGGQKMELPLLCTHLPKPPRSTPQKEVLWAQRWDGGLSWKHSELVGVPEAQRPALPDMPLFSKGTDKGNTVGGPSPPRPMETPAQLYLGKCSASRTP